MKGDMKLGSKMNEKNSRKIYSHILFVFECMVGTQRNYI